MEKLDILIPHFNDVSGLDLALQSVGKQDWKGEMRIVVCDDGSDPRFQSEIEAACKRSTVPVVLIRNASNHGRPYTRNVLLDAVESPYLAWLDAGDEWYSGKLSAQMSLLGALESQSHSGPFWVTCSYDWKWVTGLHRFLRQKVDQDQLKALLVGDDLRAYLWTIVARTEHFKQVGMFDEKLPRLQDLDYFVRFVLGGGRLHSTDAATALCAYHKSDFGRDATVIRACYQHVFEKYRPQYRRYGTLFLRNRLYNMEKVALRVARNNGDKLAAKGYARRSAWHNPFRFVGEMAWSAIKSIK